MYSNMVDIQYQPIKTIVIHEVLKHQLDDFIALKTQNGRTAATVRWVDGIIFDFIGAQALTEKLIDEKMLQGKIHWEVIEFAEMTDYQPTVSHSQTGATLHVIDNSNNTAVADAIRWLKRQPQWVNAAAA